MQEVLPDCKLFNGDSQGGHARLWLAGATIIENGVQCTPYHLHDNFCQGKTSRVEGIPPSDLGLEARDIGDNVQ
jgi:hypothetical protein